MNLYGKEIDEKLQEIMDLLNKVLAQADELENLTLALLAVKAKVHVQGLSTLLVKCFEQFDSALDSLIAKQENNK
jgi:hypothetical protein